MEFKGAVPGAPKIVPVAHMGNNGHWDFPEQLGVGVGFIYVIYDKFMSRAYLGKKLFHGYGQLNKGQESNWKRYTSSSKELNEHIKARPRDEFEFIAIEQYKTKGTLSYSETWSLCFIEAPTSNEWYNRLIEKVSWAVKEPITDRHKLRLETVLKRVRSGAD